MRNARQFSNTGIYTHVQSSQWQVIEPSLNLSLEPRCEK